MSTVSTSELSRILAGGDSFIRTKNGIVKGLAIKPEMNPDAPEVIVIGKGPRKVKSVFWFLESKVSVPVYLKQAVNSWKFLGMYSAVDYHQDSATIDKFRKKRDKDEVDGVLFLTPSDDIEVSVSSRSQPDSKTRKLIEETAISIVRDHFENQGYEIKDRQSENCGYDLMAQKDNSVLKIEVKGTSSVEQRFFITRNERTRSVDPYWKLAVVSNVLVSPKINIYNAIEMESKFLFDPLCWECTASEK